MAPFFDGIPQNEANKWGTIYPELARKGILICPTQDDDNGYTALVSAQ
jgi:hypothetical protein